MYRASSAHRDTASIFRARHLERIPQNPQQRHFRRHVHRSPLTVQQKRYGCHVYSVAKLQVPCRIGRSTMVDYLLEICRSTTRIKIVLNSCKERWICSSCRRSNGDRSTGTASGRQFGSVPRTRSRWNTARSTPLCIAWNAKAGSRPNGRPRKRTAGQNTTNSLRKARNSCSNSNRNGSSWCASWRAP